MRVVLDPNVIISATLSAWGSPGRLFRLWIDGAYDLVVSPQLLAEVDRALRFPKLCGRVPTDDKDRLLELLSRGGIEIEDPGTLPEVRSSDPDDDYLIALASVSRSVLVSGDTALLELSARIPVYSPAQFLAQIEHVY